MMMLVGSDDVPPAAAATRYVASCPLRVDRPVMRQRWERLTFLHWSFDPAQVQRLLPDGLRVQEFGGAAWVGLVPFFMHVATGGGAELPWVSRFCETNVRTDLPHARRGARHSALLPSPTPPGG